jgi:hypothetical protein
MSTRERAEERAERARRLAQDLERAREVNAALLADIETLRQELKR